MGQGGISVFCADFREKVIMTMGLDVTYALDRSRAL